MTRPSRRRSSRWLAVIGLSALLLLGSAFAVLRVKFEGEDLGETIAGLLNKNMRGRIAIGAVEWPTSALKRVITGGWVPVTMRDVRVWDDCALSAGLAGSEADRLRTGDPNEDCTPDDRPDPDPASKRKPRKLLLRTSLITAELDLHALMFGNHDFVFRDVRVHGGEALIEETREPYPLHAYDRVIVSIITAFYPRMKAGFRAGIYADSSPPVFDLRDIHIEDLNLTVHMNPESLSDVSRIRYGFTARIEGVDVDAGPGPANDAYLYMDPTDPLIAKFYVRLGLAAARGTVRILDEGPRSAFRLPYEGPSPTPEAWPPAGRKADYEIGLVDVTLDRLAQLPTSWPSHDFIANTLELDLRARTVPCGGGGRAEDGATLRLTGELAKYWDRPYDGSWNLRLDAKNLGPTVRSCIKSTIGGDDLDGTITLTGPFVAPPRIGLDLQNLDVDVPLRKDEAPIQLTLAEVHGGIDLVNEQGFIEKTKALIRGGKEPGEIALSATFGLKPPYANAQIDITKAIDVGRFLPPIVSQRVGKFLKGRLRAKGDVEVGFALEDFDLALGRTPTRDALRVHQGRLFTGDNFDTIHVEQVHVDGGKSRAIFDGFVDVLHKELELEMEGSFPDLGFWLKLFGFPQFAQSAGGGTKIKIRGKFDDLKVSASTELRGVPCLDHLRLVDARFEGDVIDIRQMSSRGLGGELTGSGRIRTGGGTTHIEQLRLSGRKLDAGKLCGLTGTVSGTLDKVEAELRDVSIDKHRSALDWLDHASVFARAPRLRVLGDAYSEVALCVNRRDDATCRPRTTYVNADDLSECASAKKSGGTCLVASARRDAGGVLDATIAKLAPARGSARGASPRLGGAISVDFPLAVIDQLIGKEAASTVAVGEAPGKGTAGKPATGKPATGKPATAPPATGKPAAGKPAAGKAPVAGTARAPAFGGHSRITLHLGGTQAAPQADGHLTLLRAWVGDAFVGDSQLRVQPIKLATGMPGVSLAGTALAGRLTISGTLGTTAPYPVELALGGHRIELDAAMDLTRRLGLSDPVQAWATGTVTVKTELAPAKPVEPEAWVELSELAAIVNHRGDDGRLTPLRLTLIDQQPGQRPAMSLRVTKGSLELACKDPRAPGGRAPCTTQLATPAGVIELRGHATEASVALQAVGTLDLSLLAPMFDRRFDEMSGRVQLAASVSGTLAAPSYEASLDLAPGAGSRSDPRAANPVRLRPAGGDTVIEAPTGLIKLANGSLGFTDVIVQVRDQHLDEQGELQIKGNILLDGLKPANWSVLISGKLAGKMLLVAVPGLVSQAGGLASIDGDIILSGKGALPLISGSLVFDPPDHAARQRALSLIPRGVRRELAFTAGGIDIETEEASGGHRTYTLSLNGVTASIDGEGAVSNIRGEVQLRDDVLTSLAVSLDADDIPFRIPGELDLVLSARAITLTKPSEAAPLAVRGKVSIIDGTYKRDFELAEQIRSIGASAAPGKPFWEEYPAIGDAELDLALDVRRFAVRSNIATIELVGPRIAITNTPRDPRMAGSIRVERGEFRIPYTRARFTRTSGSVDFAQNHKAGDPQLNLTSEADYRDQSGQEHLITLTISGALTNPQWDLRTSTGYNKSQTASLLALGRSQESLRTQRDQALGSDPTRIDPTTNPDQGVADQIVKEMAGDWIASELGDSLAELTGFDVLRISLTFSGIGVRVERKLVENLRLLGDGETTTRGTTLNLRGELKTPYRITLFDDISMQLGYLDKNFNDPAEQDIQDGNIKLVFRLFIP